jgi:hypothetical protein
MSEYKHITLTLTKCVHRDAPTVSAAVVVTREDGTGHLGGLSPREPRR